MKLLGKFSVGTVDCDIYGSPVYQICWNLPKIEKVVKCDYMVTKLPLSDLLLH